MGNNGRLYAFVLMTKSIHRLALGSEAGPVSGMMQTIGRGYVRDYNRIFRCSGINEVSKFIFCYRTDRPLCIEERPLENLIRLTARGRTQSFTNDAVVPLPVDHSFQLNGRWELENCHSTAPLHHLF